MNNPPAFPTNGQAFNGDGMSLRDYFAAKAMQALVPQTAPKHETFESVAKVIAGGAYQLADAMLKERERTP